MMHINKDKDVVIIANPRSGSYWFQSLFPHFNCLETFNLTDWDIEKIMDGGFNITNLKKNAKFDEASELAEFNLRLDWLSKVNKPKCIKILTRQFQHSYKNEFNQNVFDYINNLDCEVYWLKRKDRLASLHSYLIAKTLSKWVGPINATEITVDMSILPVAEYNLSYEKDSYIAENVHKEITHVFYEELLEKFHDNTSYVPRQHSERVTIKNWDEVLHNLSDSFKREIGIIS